MNTPISSSAAAPARQAIVCRQIEERDLPAVVDCLSRGFPDRPRSYWTHGVHALKSRPNLGDFPRYGHLLEVDGGVVGVLLQIFSTRNDTGGPAIRCNLSSWCVDPEYRALALMLQSQCTKRRGVTYVNISPAPHTAPFLEATGFRRFAAGRILFAPLLSRSRGGARVFEFTAGHPDAELLSDADRALLADHAARGCIALVGVKDGVARPLIFQRRTAGAGLLPLVHVIYCLDNDDLAAFAKPLGWFLARRGLFLCWANTDARVRGLIGKFMRGSMPHYFKGGLTPSTCDLAYTELVFLGR